MTEFGMITRVGEKHCGQPRPHPIVTSYLRAHSMRNYNQILHGDETRCEVNLRCSVLCCGLGIVICGLQTLMVFQE